MPTAFVTTSQEERIDWIVNIDRVDTWRATEEGSMRFKALDLNLLCSMPSLPNAR